MSARYNRFVQTRKRFHLSHDSYRGRQLYFVTICSAHRRPVFRNYQLGLEVIGSLKTTAAASHFLLHAWCLMPDHLHVLAEGIAEHSSLFSFVRRLKHETTAECAFGARADNSDRPLQNPNRGSVESDSLWQRNFYEHIVRNREHLQSVASYIWMNPVRKHICASPDEYPFSGSLTFGLKWNTKGSDNWLPPWKTSVRLS